MYMSALTFLLWSNIGDKMKKYLEDVKVTDEGYCTLGIIGTGQTTSNDLASHFLQNRSFDPILIRTTSQKNTASTITAKTRNIFCFLDEPNQILPILEYLKSLPFFDVSRNYYLILGSTPASSTWLRRTLEGVSDFGILNYVFVYEIDGAIKVVSYNLFSKEVYYLNDGLGYMFGDKLGNMYRQTLHVGMVPDYPIAMYVEDKFVGEDVSRIEEISKYINATLNMTVYPNTASLKKAILSGSANFSCSKLIYFSNNTRIVHPSYPLNFDYLVVIVPTADVVPQYRYLLLIFDNFVWSCIFANIAIMVTCNYYFSKLTKYKYWSLSESCMSTLRIFLNNSDNHMVKASSSLKILLITWVLYSLLISIAFDTILRKSLITPKYCREIEDQEDLVRSRLPVEVNFHRLESILKTFGPIQKNFAYVNDTELIIDNIMKYQKTSGFVLHWSATKELIKERNNMNRLIFRTLPYYFAVGHNVYNFPKNSMFLDKIEKLNQLFDQHGLPHFNVDYKGREVIVVNDRIVLTTDHLQTVFIVLVCGYLVSALVFGTEVFRSNVRSKSIAVAKYLEARSSK